MFPTAAASQTSRRALPAQMVDWGTKLAPLIDPAKQRPAAYRLAGSGRSLRAASSSCPGTSTPSFGNSTTGRGRASALSFQCGADRRLRTEVQRRARRSAFQFEVCGAVIYINNLPEYLKEGSPFLRYLRETKVPFAI